VRRASEQSPCSFRPDPALNIDPQKIVVPHGKLIKDLIKKNLHSNERKQQQEIRLQLEPTDFQKLVIVGKDGS
jgi:hypothetical protein